MADPDKEMMFNLKVQPTQIPGRQPVFWGKIRRSLHLVNGPLIFDCAGRSGRFWEGGALYGMRQFEK